MSEKNEYNIDTMAGIGKKKKIAGREYEILPVRIEDMHYIIPQNEESKTLLIPLKEQIDSGKVSWQIFGQNIVDEELKNIFIKIINKYVFYKEKPMTEKLLNEHNWSFKEIGEFLLVWVQEISE